MAPVGTRGVLPGDVGRPWCFGVLPRSQTDETLLLPGLVEEVTGPDVSIRGGRWGRRKGVRSHTVTISVKPQTTETLGVRNSFPVDL